MKVWCMSRLLLFTAFCLQVKSQTTNPGECPGFIELDVLQCATMPFPTTCSIGNDAVCLNTEKCCPGPCGSSSCKTAILPNPGVCPSFDMLTPEQCAAASFPANCPGGSDTECPATSQKCCPGPCNSQYCQDAVTGVKPGCPAIDPAQVCVQFSDECNSDVDCGNGRLCCYHPNCGRTCENPPLPPSPCPIPLCIFIPPEYCSTQVYTIINGVTCQLCPEIVPCNNDCLLPKEEGPCEASIQSFYYDIATKSCQEFRYGGCEGNANRFSTREACQLMCNINGPVTKPGRCPANQPDLVCTQQVRPGDCTGDGSCSGSLKCCRVGCNLLCVDPVADAICEKGEPLQGVTCGFGPGSSICQSGYYCNSGQCCPIPCENGTPHPTATCGQLVGSNQCPVGYSCLVHPADAYFACCPDVPTSCQRCCGPPPCCNYCEKEGQCPVVGTNLGICVQECTTDVNCPSVQKCCFNGCGHVCTNPAGSNQNPCLPLQCPWLSPGTCTEPRYETVDGVQCPACPAIVPCQNTINYRY